MVVVIERDEGRWPGSYERNAAAMGVGSESLIEGLDASIMSLSRRQGWNKCDSPPGIAELVW